jgi:hypothetical protein
MLIKPVFDDICFTDIGHGLKCVLGIFTKQNVDSSAGQFRAFQKCAKIGSGRSNDMSSPVHDLCCNEATWCAIDEE